METFRKLGVPVDMMYQSVKVGAQLLIVGIGIFGNINTIYCVITKSTLSRITNVFLNVISAALILQSLNACIDLANHWANREEYYWSPTWCLFWHTMNAYLPSMLAFLCFFAILDRFLILEHPGIHNKVMNWFTIMPMLLVSVVYPAVFAIPPIYLNWHTDDPNIPQGECKFKITLQYAFFSPLVTFWVPMVMDIVVIVKLFKAMERHDRALAVLMVGGGSVMIKPDMEAKDKAVRALPWGEDQIRHQHRLAITLWSVYWNISIFWIPQHAWQVVYKLTGADWPRATNFISWFGYMPSAILPGLMYYYDIYDI